MNRRRALIGLVVAALAARLAAAVALGGDRFRFVDESLYTEAAGQLVQRWELANAGQNLLGYPGFLALLQVLLPGGVLALRLGQAAITVVGVPVCYLLGRRLGGEAAGFAAAIVFAFDPLIVASAGLLYPEPIAALLLPGAVLCAWSSVRGDRPRLSALAGALLGILTIFRPVSLALGPAMLGWILLGSESRWRRRGTHAALVLGVWGIILLPWMAGTFRATGHLLPNAAAVRALKSVGPEAAEVGVGRALASSASEDPSRFVRRTFRELVNFWELAPSRLVTDVPEERARLAERFPQVDQEPLVRRGVRDVVSAVSFGAELLLALAGLALAWRGRRRETVWLVALVLSFALGYALFFGKVRYRIPILPIVFAYAGVGAAAALQRVRVRPAA